jgi:Tfp pilus assembly protein PilP
VKSALQGGAKPAQQPAKPTAKPAAPAAATKPAAQAAKPKAPAATKPAAQAAKPAAKPAVKPAVKSAAKPGAKAPAKPAAKKVEKAAAPRKPAPVESEVRMARRDPFESLVGRQQGKGAPNLPPGKAGLQVSTLRLDGIVKAPNGMIAVVSNPQSRTYFLREGDHLYDGTVEKISMDGVSFHEEGKDAFGKPMERQVNKRIYSSPGEQQ